MLPGLLRFDYWPSQGGPKYSVAVTYGSPSPTRKSCGPIPSLGLTTRACAVNEVAKLIERSSRTHSLIVGERGNVMNNYEKSLDQIAGGESPGKNKDPILKEYDIATNGITLHVTEQGEGPAVLFCHGFPDTSYTWRRQMRAVAAAGYRAIAPDMRGYGRSSAPEDGTLYTPLHTVGDLVGLLDELKVSSAVIVGHDWGPRMRGTLR